jgi:hypothetical protein
MPMPPELAPRGPDPLTAAAPRMAHLLAKYLAMHDKRWALDGASDDAPECCGCPVCVEARAILATIPERRRS